MKNLRTTVFVIIITFAGLSRFPVTALPAATAASPNSNLAAATNNNVNAPEPSEAEKHEKRLENIAKLREPAKLVPLLYIPLAAGLYLLYRRFSKREKE